MSSRFTSTNTRRDDKRRMEDSLRDDESLIGGGGGGGGTLTTTSTPLTSPLVTSTPPVTSTTTTPMTTINSNNNIDYFNHLNSSGLNAAAMNSMTNDILQNKSSIEMNRNEAYKRLNSKRSLTRSSSQIFNPINNSNIEEGNSIYPSFLTPKNDYCNRNSIKRPLFIFSEKQTNDEIDLNSTVLSNGKRISGGSMGIRRISKSSSSISISVGSNTNNDNSNNLGVRRISGHVKHQKSFESSMGLIAEENFDGSLRTIMTKRNHSSTSVSREASDVTSTALVTTSTTYSASTTVSTTTTTTVISPSAVAAAKASWNKPDDISDIDERSNSDEDKRLSDTSDSMEKREWLTKRPVSPLPRRKTLPKLSNL